MTEDRHNDSTIGVFTVAVSSRLEHRFDHRFDLCFGRKTGAETNCQL
jgi:hypothetical protein